VLVLKRLLPTLQAYGFAVACVATSSAIAYFVHPYAVIGDLAMIELLGVVAVAMRQSVRVSLFAALLSNLSLAFLFVPPRFHLSLSDIERGVIYAAMIVVAVVISALNERLRKEEQLARAAAFRAEALYALNHELSTATDTRQLVAVTTRHLERLLTADQVTVLLGAPESWPADTVSDSDRAPAERAWVRRDFTSTRDQKPAAVWIPLSGSHSPLGVIGVRVIEPFPADSPEGFLLSACGNQLGTALERVQLAQVVHRTELEAEAERLKSSLLSAVSHDLKTPVAAIIAAGTTLLEHKKVLDTAGERALLSSIVSEGERLTRLIQNLLSVIRLDSPTVELNRTPESVEEIVASTVDRFAGLLDTSHVTVDLEPDLPLVSAEPLLLQQVLINLLENAARYAGSGHTSGFTRQRLKTWSPSEFPTMAREFPSRSAKRSSRNSTEGDSPARGTAEWGSGSRSAGPSSARTGVAFTCASGKAGVRWSSSPFRSPRFPSVPPAKPPSSSHDSDSTSSPRGGRRLRDARRPHGCASEPWLRSGSRRNGLGGPH